MIPPTIPSGFAKNGFRFAVAHLNEKAKRRFVLKKRIFFAAFNALALIAMFTTQKLSPNTVPWWYTIVSLFSWLVFWTIGAWLRRNHTISSITFMILGWIAVGTAAGFFANPATRLDFWAATCVLGCALIGSIVDTLCFHSQHSPVFHFSHNGVWILTGGILTYLFPDTEWALALAGTFAILMTFALNASQNRIFNTFCYTQYVAAASNVPTIFMFPER